MCGPEGAERRRRCRCHFSFPPLILVAASLLHGLSPVFLPWLKSRSAFPKGWIKKSELSVAMPSNSRTGRHVKGIGKSAGVIHWAVVLANPAQGMGHAAERVVRAEIRHALGA